VHIDKHVEGSPHLFVRFSPSRVKRLVADGSEVMGKRIALSFIAAFLLTGFGSGQVANLAMVASQPSGFRTDQQPGLSFANAVAYGSGGAYAFSVAVADVNGDGKPDIVVANCSRIKMASCPGKGTVGILLGNGDGTFQKVRVYASGGYEAASVAIADVNGDGKPDLLVANGCTRQNCQKYGKYGKGRIGVLLGNGDGTFRPPSTYGSGGWYAGSVTVADVNGDGKPDVLVANACFRKDCKYLGNGGVGVLLGKGDGTFQKAVGYASGGAYASSIAVADVNGDGKPDLLVANRCVGGNCRSDGSVGILLGNGDGTFGRAVSYDTGAERGYSLAVSDLNADGNVDIVVGSRCIKGSECSASNDGVVTVLLGNGNGTFQTAVAYDSGGNGAFSVAVADVNGDGKPDIIVAGCSSGSNCAGGGSGNGIASILLGNGDGSFQAAVVFGSGGEAADSVAILDVNLDGKPDLVVANQCDSNGACGREASVGVLINTSTAIRR
jgi:hypothetical protein